MEGSLVRLSSVNIVVRDARGRTLLQMRDSAAKSSPLLWSFWSGAVDVDDKNAYDAAAREISEELSVAASPDDFIEVGARIDSRGRKAALLLYKLPLHWENIRISEGAGAGYFWREEIERLPVAPAVAWHLKNQPDLFPGAIDVCGSL